MPSLSLRNAYGERDAPRTSPAKSIAKPKDEVLKSQYLQRLITTGYGIGFGSFLNYTTDDFFFSGYWVVVSGISDRIFPW
ncbi:MAG TPA: hypothetical protein V6D50_15780 [Chroococcales cyanobacterium]